VVKNLLPRPCARRARAGWRGFTLLEILVVVVIVGMLTALSSGPISGYMAQQKVVRAAGALQNDIEAAFAIAARNRRPIRLEWRPTTLAFAVTDRASATTFRQSILGESYGLRTGEVSVSASPIEIFPSGLASDTLLIEISAVRGSVTHTRRVRMSRAGMVRIL
jgi:prepilin-type N-terminal cleavage/methylation domain-containing protein